MDQRTGIIFLSLAIFTITCVGIVVTFLYYKGAREGWMSKRVFLLMTGASSAFVGLILAVFFIIALGAPPGIMLIGWILGIIFAVLGMYIGLSVPRVWKLPK